MKLNLFAHSLLLVLFDSQRAESQPLPHIRHGVKQLHQQEENLVTVAVSKPQANVDVTNVANRRSLATTSSWVQVANFTYQDGDDSYGFTVSMSGDGTLLAATPLTDNLTGIVRFFQKQGETWEERTDLQLTGAAYLDACLSNDAKRVAIKGISNSDANDDSVISGSVSVYEMSSDGSTWSLMGVIQEEYAKDAGGFSIAFSKDGKTLAIGVAYHDGSFSIAYFRVRVFQWDVGTSSFQKMGEFLDKEDGEETDISVALSQDGTVVAFGAPGVKSASGEKNTGLVRVFSWDSGEATWSPRVPLVGEQGDDYFGWSVDLSEDGNILAVGAPGIGLYFKVLRWKDGDGENKWEQIGDKIEGPAMSYRFGKTISISSSGSNLAASSLSGSHTYTLVGNAWDEPAGELRYGYDAALSRDDGKTLAVGSSESGGGGSVFIYGLQVDSPSGSNGDPHFRKWNGDHFEYHGQCDMILVKDEDFADGLGLEVQIRTKLGSPDLSVNKANNHYWINSVYQGQVTSLGGFPVKATYEGKHKNKRWFFSKYGGGNKISRSFEIDLSSRYPGQKIVIGSFKEFVRVDFHNAKADAFGNSVGMLGDFATGKTLARDGTTELNDYTMLGHEWQVLPHQDDDGMLFHNVSHPQFPEKCIDPEAGAMKRRRRRLGESSITDEQAEAACASIENVLDRKDCIYDILVTQDLTMVGAY
eukprot:scaffold1794_cov107-Cylindrotheca_fusiformis.AAC.2